MNARESRLATLTAGMLLLGILLFGANSYLDRSRELAKTERQLDAEIDSLNGFLGNREVLEKKSAWITDNLPSYPVSESMAQKHLLQQLTRLAQQSGVELPAPSPEPIADGAPFPTIRVDFEVSGDYSNLLDFFIGLENQTAFRVVSDLNFPAKPPKPDDPALAAKISLQQFYAPRASTPVSRPEEIAANP